MNTELGWIRSDPKGETDRGNLMSEHRTGIDLLQRTKNRGDEASFKEKYLI